MRLTVGAKIGASFLLGTLFLAAIGWSSYSALDRQQDAARWQVHTYRVLNLLESVLKRAIDAETGQRGYLLTGSEDYLEPYQQAAGQLKEELETLRKEISDNPLQASRGEQLSSLIDERMHLLAQNIAQRRERGLEVAVRTVLTGAGKKNMDSIRAQVAVMESEETGLLAKRTQEAEATTSTTKVVIVGGGGLTILLLALLGFLLSTNIASPLKSLTRTAERVAVGDLETSPEESKRTDEVGILIRAFVKMIKSLRGLATVADRIAQGDLTTQVELLSAQDALGSSFSTMLKNLRALTGEIAESVDQLVSSSNEILAGTTQVASSSTETAAAITETTTTVEEVRQAAKLSSDKAKTVTDNAQNIIQVSQSGLSAVEETNQSMARIRTQTALISQTISNLSDQSQAIGEIIATVTDLADQSNMLAVNAAIEAARIGEAGKGFSIVAQEIKSLAEQSKQATTQVRTILGDIQRSSAAAVTAVDLGTKAVEAGVLQATQTGEAIQLLAESCEASVESSLQIAASSQQQVVGMDQIGIAMRNINQAGSETVASMRQSERAAQDLSALGRKLLAAASRFQL